MLTDVEFIRARHAVTEIARVLEAVIALEAKNFNRLGELLNASHASLRDDYSVSCPELNTAVDASLSAGALGARMVGGGFGGSAIALIEAKNTQATIEAVESGFAGKKFKAPRFFTSLPSQGAEIIQRGL
jgi:galactokinase